MCVTEWWTFRPCGSLSLHKHCETQPCAERIDGHFRTVGLSLKFHPSAFVVLSEGREDKQVHMYKEIIPGPAVRTFRQHRAEKVAELRGIGIQGPWGLRHSTFVFIARKGIFFSGSLRAVNASEGGNHADPVSAALIGRVSHAVWISLGSLRGDSPDELQLYQKPARGFRQQRRRHCQPQSAHLSFGKHRTQIRWHLAGNCRA